jgi:hypothetical protein
MVALITRLPSGQRVGPVAARRWEGEGTVLTKAALARHPIALLKILPGTGRGTIASAMVEGDCGVAQRLAGAPSVMPAACHLPVPGRISGESPSGGEGH